MTTAAERVEAWNADLASQRPDLVALGWLDDVRELGWIVDLLDEVISDLRVFFHVDDPMSLTGRAFFERARFLPRYQGAVGAHFMQLEVERAEAEREEQRASAPAYSRPASTSSPRREVLQGDAAIAKMSADGWAGEWGTEEGAAA